MTGIYRAPLSYHNRKQKSQCPLYSANKDNEKDLSNLFQGGLARDLRQENKILPWAIRKQTSNSLAPLTKKKHKSFSCVHYVTNLLMCESAHNRAAFLHSLLNSLDQMCWLRHTLKQRKEPG